MPASALEAHRRRLQSGPRLSPAPMITRSSSYLSASPLSSPEPSPTTTSFDVDVKVCPTRPSFAKIGRGRSVWTGANRCSDFTVEGRLSLLSLRRESSGSSGSGSGSEQGHSPRKMNFASDSRDTLVDYAVPALGYSAKSLDSPISPTSIKSPTAILFEPGNNTGKELMLDDGSDLRAPVPVMIAADGKTGSVVLSPAPLPPVITTSTASLSTASAAPVRPPAYLPVSPRLGTFDFDQTDDMQINHLHSAAIASRAAEIKVVSSTVLSASVHSEDSHEGTCFPAGPGAPSNGGGKSGSHFGQFNGVTSCPLKGSDEDHEGHPRLASPNFSNSPRGRFSEKFKGPKLDLASMFDSKQSKQRSVSGSALALGYSRKVSTSSAASISTNGDERGEGKTEETCRDGHSSINDLETSSKLGKALSLRRRPKSRPGSSSGLSAIFRSRPSSSSGLGFSQSESETPGLSETPKAADKGDSKVGYFSSARPTSRGGESISSIDSTGSSSAKRIATKLLRGLRPTGSGSHSKLSRFENIQIESGGEDSDATVTPSISPPLHMQSLKSPIDVAMEIGLAPTPPLDSPIRPSMEFARATPWKEVDSDELSALPPPTPRLAGFSPGRSKGPRCSSDSFASLRPSTPPSPLELPGGLVALSKEQPWRLGEVEAEMYEAAMKAQERHRKRSTMSGVVGQGWQGLDRNPKPRSISTPSSILSASTTTFTRDNTARSSDDAETEGICDAGKEEHRSPRPTSWSPATFTAQYPLRATGASEFSSPKAKAAISRSNCPPIPEKSPNRRLATSNNENTLPCLTGGAAVPQRPCRSKLRQRSSSNTVQTLRARLQDSQTPVPPTLRCEARRASILAAGLLGGGSGVDLTSPSPSSPKSSVTLPARPDSPVLGGYSSSSSSSSPSPYSPLPASTTPPASPIRGTISSVPLRSPIQQRFSIQDLVERGKRHGGRVTSSPSHR
ncbi:hypothetical protein IE53DRAFT_370359 [Violaceomyces palustris]|uniref:Uncharacterized protein n=1 Tax=Violaceomyces palustris TaxID=1673888 RepID=A0ACD0NSD6_9BASI|nr:hypothetical protein IE53DRAFT_370359 [Violaceomyces palustris]